MAKKKRFIKSFAQGGFTVFVDTETGVNYLYYNGGYTGGLTPLLDSDGKVVITPISE